MPTKVCFKCCKRKDIEQFYIHPQMADGHLNKCKSCTKEDVRRRYDSPDGRKKCLVYERLRQKDPARKAAKKVYQQRRRANRPGVAIAYRKLANAIRDGRVVRKPCEVCGNPKTEGHHDDYRKPLCVRWLCFKHHRELEHNQTVGIP